MLLTTFFGALVHQVHHARNEKTDHHHDYECFEHGLPQTSTFPSSIPRCYLVLMQQPSKDGYIYSSLKVEGLHIASLLLSLPTFFSSLKYTMYVKTRT
jgi:hypothetical protein